MINLKCPLSDEDCAALNAALQECADLKCVYEKLRAAGAPVDEQMTRLEGTEYVAQALKRAIFPDRP